MKSKRKKATADLQLAAADDADVVQGCDATYAVPPLLINDRQGCAACGFSRATWWRYVKQGLLPQPVRIGGSTRWRWSEVAAAIAALAE